jgi:glycosyltransferase involved in cell wall biosynthesis
MGVQISIALTTYNGEKYIRAQLESYSNQKFLPTELVVCDDGSTDRTLEIIINFASTSKFPVHIHQNSNNLGFSSNFIKCASLCKGNWIAFSDQDDVWFPEKLLKIVQKIESDTEKKLLLVCHSAELVDEFLVPSGTRVPNIIRDKVTDKNENYGFICIAGFTTTFRADLLLDIDSSLRPNDYFQPSHKLQSHDKWIAMLANTFGKIAFISESLAMYRRHEEALSGSYGSISPLERIKKSSKIGATYYKFQSEVAKSCADTYVLLSKINRSEIKINDLLNGAKKYNRLSDICNFRMKLYSEKKIFIRIKILIKMIFAKAYWGDKFYSFGTLSFLKDIYYIFKKGE